MACTPFAVASALALAPPAAAQDPGPAPAVVRGTRVEVVLPDSGTDVTVRVRIDVVPDADGSVPLALLELPTATGIDVRDEDGRPVSLETESGTRRSGAVTPDAAGRDPDGVTRLVFTYVVPDGLTLDANRYEARIPVLGASAAPVEAGGGVFDVEIRLPAAWTLVDGFPSALRAESPGTWTATLPVVPSMVTARGRTDGAWRPGATLLVELVTVVVLLAFALFGWTRLRAAERLRGRAT
jgi:hypothetical protein